MRVIGTAGHVDHGKSTLVKALTGINPDRLKEEREREMTIDLGFAWFTLQDGEEVGIVDVPGHIDFIENMLAGIGGIDAALFVVAADESVMPQTREHLAIIDILQIQGGVVALTKIDLVDDEWLELVEDELVDVLSSSVLKDAPIVRVSGKTGEGIPQLLKALALTLSDSPPRSDTNRPRLPIDRVFTIAGFGTVVTGTLSDGHIAVGDEVEIMPRGLRGRVRGLQTHKRQETFAVPGSRTAINISGVPKNDLIRGDVVTHPGDYQATRRLDVHFRLLPNASQSIKHNTQVKLFIGSSEVLARLRLLGSDELIPGQDGWLQLEPRHNIVAVRGDHYILRRPSPGETLGGGKVVDPHPGKRHKRFSEETIAVLEELSRGTPSDILLQTIHTTGPATWRNIVGRTNLDQENVNQAIGDLLANESVMILGPGQQDRISDHRNTIIPQISNKSIIVSQTTWDLIQSHILREVKRYHEINPLKSGMPREELRSRIIQQYRNSNQLFDFAINNLVVEDHLEENGPMVFDPGHSIRYNETQTRAIEELMKRFKVSPYTPPSVKESRAAVGDDVYAALLDQGQLIAVSTDVVFQKEIYDRMILELKELFSYRETLTAAEVRDHFQTSRKYVLALLEYLDTQGVTKREGDVRRLRK